MFSSSSNHSLESCCSYNSSSNKSNTINGSTTEPLSSPFDQAMQRPLMGEPTRKKWSLWSSPNKKNKNQLHNSDNNNNNKYKSPVPPTEAFANHRNYHSSLEHEIEFCTSSTSSIGGSSTNSSNGVSNENLFSGLEYEVEQLLEEPIKYDTSTLLFGDGSKLVPFSLLLNQPQGGEARTTNPMWSMRTNTADSDCSATELLLPFGYDHHQHQVLLRSSANTETMWWQRRRNLLVATTALVLFVAAHWVYNYTNLFQNGDENGGTPEENLN